MRVLAALGAAYRVLGGGDGREPAPVDRTLRLAVADRAVVADGVVALRLVGPGPLPRWQPGCHLDVALPSGRRRQYSLTGDPGDRHSYRIAVRLLGPGSAEAHDLRPGDRLAVRGPRNAFPFVPRPHMLFVAGGIGITPIAPMVRAAARLGVDWQLVYTGRTRPSMPFLDVLSSRRVSVRPDDECGTPTDLLRSAPDGAAVYACGPPRMLDALRADLPASRATALHTERFSPAPVVGGRPFRLVLARSGAVLDVPADRTALDVVREVRPDVAYSCRQGFCGTCRIGEHLICTARPAGDRLVLDL
ncbi:PDR/VanB family oxidoreductase [Pseudonocardia saturnea]